MKIELYITRLKIFSIIDHILSKSVSTSDNIVVFCFWRSGTTFIMELVARLSKSRSYFEPLLLKIPVTWPPKYRRRNSPEIEKLTIPDALNSHPYYYANTQQLTTPIDPFLDSIMLGKVSSKWTRKSRRLKFTLSKNLLVKLVRGNLLAGHISQRYGCKSIFVLRHPCGVVASVIRSDINRSKKRGIETGLISDGFIKSLFSQEALVQDYLSPFIDAINKWNTNSFNRIVLAWAITNYVPLKQMQDNEFSPHFILYERFVAEEGSGKLSEYLNIDSTKSLTGKHLNKDSVSVQRERKDTSPADRLFSWKHELSQDQIATIYEICACFGSVLKDQIAAIDVLGADKQQRAYTS